MSAYKKAMHRRENSVQVLLRLQGLGDRSISDYIARTRAKYGKHALTIEEVRSIVDRSMGERTLSEVLYQMRESQS